MKNLKQALVLGVISAIGVSTSAHATRITTGNLSNSTTAGTPLNAQVSATPTAIIRFEVGGANYSSTSTPLTVSISVDASTPSVTSGPAADQSFKDDTVGAAYFGYYLTTGVRSSNQTAAGMNIKIKKGSGETSGRSYYLLGNGTTTPTQQSDLTVAPASVTTFAATVPNSVHCGPSHAANGLTGSGINCSGGTTVANMDVTQFVKVLYSDPAGTPIVSDLQFIAVNE